MTLSSTIKTISNDKVLSILTLFSVILICTLLYYNLSDKLLNITVNTREYFADKNVNCEPIILLTDQEQQYSQIAITDEEGIIKKHVIVDEDEKLNINVDMTINYLNSYLNKLNEDFAFEDMRLLFTEPKRDVTEIKNIIKDRLQNCNVNLDTIDSIMGTHYDNDIFKILEAYRESQIDNSRTKKPKTKYYELLYISNLYKLILTLLVSIDIVITEQKVQKNMKKANKYLNTSYIYKPFKRRAKNNLKKLIKLYLAMSVISNQELFQKTIKYNLLSNYMFNGSGTLERTPLEILEPEIQVFTIKNNLKSLIDFIKDKSSEQIQKVIQRFNDDINTMFKTKNITYEHIFNWMPTNSSIIKTYTSDEYDICDQAIADENASDLGSY
jgi:hypothetical protein